MSYRGTLETTSQRILAARAQELPGPPEASGPSLWGAYKGRKVPLFRLALKTGLLTVLTLGIYRFWERTRVRAYMWSATAPGGQPFEYTGTGLEKFLGFLIAVVILAVYLGIAQMALTLAGLSMIDGSSGTIELSAAGNLAIIGVYPLILIAQYRSRRYLLSRTRWRGIRFGVEPGAVGYMLRGFFYGALVLVSLGLLLPLATFKMEQYRVDRTYFGDAQMTQAGKWTMLYQAMRPLIWGGGLLALSLVAMPFIGTLTAAGPAIAGGLVMFYGLIHYRVQSFAILARHKVLAYEIGFSAEPMTGAIIKRALVGGLLVGLVAIAFFGIVFAVVFGIVYLAIGTVPLDAGIDPAALGADFSQSALGILGTLVILSLFFAVSSAARLVFIQQPILAHYVETFSVKNPGALDRIRQREGDTFADADGFADALDVGAGF